MANFCDDVSVDPAVLMTLQAHDRFTELGTRTYELARGDLEAFQNITLNPLQFSVSFDFDGQLPQFQRPPRPQINREDFEFRDPGDVVDAPTFIPTSIAVDTPPEFDTPPPQLNFGTRPERPILTAPTAPQQPPLPTMPEEPDWASYVPDPVTLLQLNLPTLGEIKLPEFDAQRPEFVEPPLNDNWTFTPTQYASLLLTELQGKLRAMLAGEQVLPMAIQRAIFDRGRGRAEVEGQRALDQVYDEFAGLGFSEPNGLLAARVADQRQVTQNAISELNRDLTIKDFEEALANLRLAIAQGAALEGVTINLHVEEQRVLLRAAEFRRETDIAILNARVTVFNARMQAYEIDARVLQIRIQAELSKLDEYRARLEAERLRGQINEQSVRLYAEQWRAVQTLADFYRSRVEAVKVEAEVNKIPIEIFREEVQAYSERWRAYSAEVQGFSAGAEAEGKKADVYETLARIFGTRMQGYSALQDVRFRGEDLRLRQHGQQLEVWGAGLRRKAQLLDAERARLAAVAAGADAFARIYTADGSISQAESAAADRSLQIGLEAARARMDGQLKTADLYLQQHLGLLQQAVELVRAQAQISGQLAASTFAAVNYGASVNSGRSKSQSCNESFNFTGEIADAGIT